jgi:hypothetical protein
MHGRSSVVIAYAIRNGKLFCIDLWDGQSSYPPKFNDNVIKLNGFPIKGTLNTLDFFLENTKAYKNIEIIKGNSPSVVHDWSDSIDFLFLDSSHKNPNDIDNINFWLPKIKKNGCLVGHDYSTEWPDVVSNVRYLEDILGQPVSLYPNTSIWKFDIHY